MHRLEKYKKMGFNTFRFQAGVPSCLSLNVSLKSLLVTGGTNSRYRARICSSVVANDLPLLR